MKIEVDITREDYWRFNRYFMTRTLKSRLLTWAVLVMGAIALLLVGALLLLSGDLSSMMTPEMLTLLALLGGCGVLVVAMRLGLKLWIMRLPSEGAGMLGKHLIELTADGVVERTDVSEGRHRWSGVVDVREDAHAIYIFVDRMQAHIIPRRAFPDQGAAREFYEVAERYWRGG